jgi:hypothetical protein
MTTTLTTPTDQERRTYGVGIELRNAETNGSLSLLRGRAVPYGDPADIGWFVETFAPGSLGKSAKESARALPLLVFHNDQAFPVGVAQRWDEQSDGLWGEWRLSQTQDAQHAATQVADGFLNFMSVRFAPIRSEWTYASDFNPDLGPSHKDSVKRIEARLLETSLVSTPAYNGATVEWVRSGERNPHQRGGTPQLDAWRAELEKLRA